MSLLSELLSIAEEIDETLAAEERKGRAELAGFNAFFDSPENYVAQGGAESIECVLERTRDFWENEIRKLENEKVQNVLVATHGGTLQALLMNVDGRSISHFWDVKIPNCTVNLVTLTSGIFKLEYTAKVFY